MEMGTDVSGRHLHRILLRNSVNTEVLQGLSGGGTPGQSDGSAYTRPNDDIFDCSKRVNDSFLSECENTDSYMSLGG
jgi:hypothetical protein